MMQRQPMKSRRTTKPRRPMTEAGALQRLAALCAKAEHCSGEMDEKMIRWGLDADTRQRVLDKLIELHYVDDERFCESFVNDKIRFDRWGRRKIEQALWQKKIPQEIAKKVLDPIDDKVYLDVLMPLLRSKWPSIKANSDYERSLKLIRYGLSRGFSIDLIRQCIDRLGRELDGMDGDACDDSATTIGEDD